MKLYLSFIIAIFSYTSIACTYKDLTSEKMLADRDAIFKDSSNNGTRVAWKDMKGKNKKYLIGTVDKIVKGYEEKLCNQFSSDDFKKRYPGIEVEINKMDFKGYYVTCKPLSKCKKLNIENEIKKVSPPVFEATPDMPRGESFDLITSDATGYQEGYVKARVTDTYPDYDGKMNVGEFLDIKVKEGIIKATGDRKLREKNIKDPKFIEMLRINTDYYRAEDISKIDPKFIPLIEAIDAMETPFSGSSNFDDELTEALKSQTGKKLEGGKYKVSIARGGDDMTLVIKEKGKIIKIVGIDARGLGSMNITTRYESYLKNLFHGNSMSSTSDLINIADEGLTVADKKMFASMDAYVEVLEKNLNTEGKRDMNQIIRKAHEEYIYKQEKSSEMMQMRAGAMDACGVSNECVKNQITNIHNTIKTMEKAGIETHFGDSCIGTEYWARKLGAKPLRSLENQK